MHSWSQLPWRREQKDALFPCRILLPFICLLCRDVRAHRLGGFQDFPFICISSPCRAPGRQCRHAPTHPQRNLTPKGPASKKGEREKKGGSLQETGPQNAAVIHHA